MIATLLSLFLTFSGSLSAPPADGEAKPNAFCPVQTEEVVDPEIFTSYQGERVYFCCKRCRKQFLNNPAVYVENLPQFKNPSHEQSHQDSEDQEEAHSHEQEHDHGTGHGEPHGIGRLVRFLGKFHPTAVHFPIALILAAALAEILLLGTRKQFFRDAARFSIAAGALSALATAGLGWAAWFFAQYPGELGEVLEIHRWLGTSTTLLAAACAFFSEASYRPGGFRFRGAYKVTLFLTAALVSLTGFFGGTLLYGWEHFNF